MRMLCVVDEFTREALAIRVARRLRSHDVIDVLAELMLTRGVPEHVRSDNGAEFNGKLRDELLNGEIFYSLREAQVLIEAWRRHYNAVRPHGSLGWKPPAPETLVMPSWPLRLVGKLEMEAAMN